MTIENINIKPLMKAFDKFEMFRININAEQEKERRNITVHTYEEKEAAKVLEILPIFSNEIKKFLHIINNN